MRVLVTRPQGDAVSVAALLAARGHEAVVAPLLTVTFDKGAAVDLTGVQAVLLTSANGARALAAASDERNIRVLAVGAATAATANLLEFRDVASADSDITGLADLVRNTLDPGGGRLLHVAGRDVAGDLAASLPDFRVERKVLYRAQTAEDVPTALRDALASGDVRAALFYSPRTAATFARLANSAGLGQHCAPMAAVCLSAAVANALEDLPFREVVVAEYPDQDHLLAALDAVANAKEG